MKTIEIIDIECVLGHESCLHIFRACSYIASILNLARSEYLQSINKAKKAKFLSSESVVLMSMSKYLKS